MPAYEAGDQVEYRPIGGSSDNISHSVGVIEKISEGEGGETHYTIRTLKL